MVNRTAFGGSEEAELVDKLRDSDALVSLVAESELSIVGHIMLSRMWIRTTSEVATAVALAPVAVLPDFQRQGIGARLIDEGLARMKQRGERIVIVVGHPSYYPRFGFSADKAVSLESPFPPEAFMALELGRDHLRGSAGQWSIHPRSACKAGMGAALFGFAPERRFSVAGTRERTLGYSETGQKRRYGK